MHCMSDSKEKNQRWTKTTLDRYINQDVTWLGLTPRGGMDVINGCGQWRFCTLCLTFNLLASETDDHSFTHLFLIFQCASSNPLLLRGAPDYSIDILSEEVNTPKRYRQLWVKDLPKVSTCWLEWDSNLRPSGGNSPHLPLSHHAPQSDDRDDVDDSIPHDQHHHHPIIIIHHHPFHLSASPSRYNSFQPLFHLHEPILSWNLLSMPHSSLW